MDVKSARRTSTQPRGKSAEQRSEWSGGWRARTTSVGGCGEERSNPTERAGGTTGGSRGRSPEGGAGDLARSAKPFARCGCCPVGLGSHAGERRSRRGHEVPALTLAAVAPQTNPRRHQAPPFRGFGGLE